MRAVAYVAFLDAQRQVNRKKKIGTHGLLASKIKARLYFAIASDDDKREPQYK